MKAQQTTQAIIVVLIYGIFWWGTILAFQSFFGGERFEGWKLLLYLCPSCWVVAHIIPLTVLLVIGSTKIGKMVCRRS